MRLVVNHGVGPWLLRIIDRRPFYRSVGRVTNRDYLEYTAGMYDVVFKKKDPPKPVGDPEAVGDGTTLMVGVDVDLQKATDLFHMAIVMGITVEYDYGCEYPTLDALLKIYPEDKARRILKEVLGPIDPAIPGIPRAPQ